VVDSGQYAEEKLENTKHGIDYDFSLDFFTNFQNLFKKINLPNLYFE